MNKIKDFLGGLKGRLDFGFNFVTLSPLLILLLTYPAMLWLPIEYTYENHLIENFQLVVLLAAFIVCLKAKVDKKFFNSLALVMIILFLREINCGRTIFFSIEGTDNAFYSWKEIPWGWIVNPLYAVFMIGSGLYFLCTKSYEVLFKYILKAKVSVYNWVFLFLGMILGTVGEEIGNFALEEMTETLFYLALFALCFLHGLNKNYIEAVEK